MAKLTEKDALKEAIAEYNAAVNNSTAKTLAGAGQLQQEVYIAAVAGAAQPINRLTARGRIRGAVADGASVSRTYATWNPADKTANITLSGSNLIASNSAGFWHGVKCDQGKSSGKWYFEFTRPTAFSTADVGITDSAFVLTVSGMSAGVNAIGNRTTGAQKGSGVTLSSGIGGMADLATAYMVAVDMDNLKFYIGNAITNTWYGGGTPATGATWSYTLSATTFYIATLINEATGKTVTINTGQSAFVGIVPAGFNSGWYI